MAMLRPRFGRLFIAFVLAAGLCGLRLPGDAVPPIRSVGALPDMHLATPHRFERVAKDRHVPWEIAFLPDGRLMFTERDGHVSILGPPGTQREALRIVVAQGIKLGMLGLALDPGFAANHLVYLAYDQPGGGDERPSLRVVRYRLEGERLAGPTTLIDGIPANVNHTGCRLVFAPDGTLYITTGDADEPAKAQRLDTLNGKILRLNRDGSIPRDNPFVRMPGARPEIWSYGHRNPQGLAFDPRSGMLFASEHGPNGGDEINIIVRGGNYGWPVVDHARVADGMRPPLFEFTPSIAPGKAMLYRGDAFPELRGRLIVALLRGEGLLVFDRAGGRLSNPRRLFHHDFGRIRAITEGPDGDLYLSTSQEPPLEGLPVPDYDLIVRVAPSRVGQVYPTIRPRAPVEAGPQTPLARAIDAHCAACHGPALRGRSAPDLVGRAWSRAHDEASLQALMVNGIPDRGMPPNAAITPDERRLIAAYLLTRAPTP